VVPDASIISLRVFECDSEWTDDILRGLDYVSTVLASQYGIASVNMSLGNGQFYGADCGDADSGKRAYAAVMNRLKVDVLAPGSSIYSAVGGGSFEYKSGTSMATPHVAGAFAALRSRVPAATVDQIEQVLEATGKPVTDSDSGITKPRIEVAQALYQLGVSPAPAWHAQESFGGALWSTPKSLGDSVVAPGSCICIASGSSSYGCFFLGTDRALKQIRLSGTTWGAWANLGGALLSGPSCLRIGNSQTQCFAVGLGGMLQQLSWNGTAWQPWRSLGSGLKEQPSCVAPSGARMDCFVRGVDNRLKHLAYH
jgi:hypothetical protein